VTATVPSENELFSFAPPNAPAQQSSGLFQPAQLAASQGHSQSMFMTSKPSSDTSSQSQSSLFSQNTFAPRSSTPTFGGNQTPKPLFPVANAATARSAEQSVKVSEPEGKRSATAPPGMPEANLFSQQSEAETESRPASIEPTRHVMEDSRVATRQELAQPIGSSETDEWQPPGKLTSLHFNSSQVLLLTGSLDSLRIGRRADSCLGEVPLSKLPRWCTPRA
jgi:hypothetical protein